MISLRTLLFLIGTTIASCHVLKNGKPCKEKHFPISEPHVFNARLTPESISPLQQLFFRSPNKLSEAPAFVQQGTNLYYKPQFAQPSDAFLTSPINNIIIHKDCKKNKIQGSVPVAVVPASVEVMESKPMEIPEPPQLPPLREPVIVEEIIENEKPMHIPQPPELPPFSMPEFLPVPEYKPHAVPTVVEVIPEKLPQIPEAPILPPFTMSDLPHVVIPVAPELPSVPQYDTLTIPEAPVLPPLTMPAPSFVEEISHRLPAIPEAPVLPPLTMPAPTFLEEIPHRLTEIPEAPILPPFTMPELPSVVIPVSPELPCVPEYKPSAIPEAPVLPPLSILEQPMYDRIQTLEIPEPPALPPLSISELPAPIYIPAAPELPATTVFKPINIPEPPTLPPLALHDIPSPDFISVVPEAPAVNVFSNKPLEIPEPPMLPPLIHCPPETADLVLAPEIKPIEIPPAPVLPPFEMPSFSIIENAPAHKTVVQLAEIPPAPKLPPLSLPANPILVQEHEIHEEPCDDDEIHTVKVSPTVYIPEVPYIASPKSESLEQPTFWAQNVIIERFLPSVHIRDKKSLDKALEEGTKHPVITKPYFTTGTK